MKRGFNWHLEVKNEVNGKIKSLSLKVEFDFSECKCTVIDLERDLKDEYRCLVPFGDTVSDVNDIDDFNHFVGDCVHAFLDDNDYSVYDDEDDMEDAN